MPRRTDAPLLLPCHGTTEDGARVEDVARDLEDRGLGEVAHGLDEAIAATQAGREVLTLDGCAASCQARLLDARGVHAGRALNLADRLEADATPLKRTRRPPSVTPQTASRRNHSLDDYLLAVDALTSPIVECGAVVDAPTLSAHVAQVLGVSRATAGEMLARLESEGLVERGMHKDLLLTGEGRTVTDRILRQQRILECFAVATLGHDVADCHERARELAPGFDADALERPWEALGRPDRCPHGRPVDAAEARRTVRDLVALVAVQPGARVTVDRLEEGNSDRLHALADAGIEPGRTLADVRLSTAAGVVSFRVDGRERAISATLAGSVLVR
ncbi:MAG: iron dependent repressor, metal binding and dimerization domain protein [Actinomycetota bacterium]